VAVCRVAFKNETTAFEVEDPGQGFAPGDEKRAFDAFYRGPAKAKGDKERSLGLGLNLVRRTAEAHGGTAYAENLASGGARVGFSVRSGS
jgi:two-component system, OmpR family, sensor kinase